MVIDKDIQLRRFKTPIDPRRSLTLNDTIKLDDADITVTKLTDSDDDFEDFKQIITHEDVIFSSWFMANQFDMSSIKRYCDTFELKINLSLAGDPDVCLPDEILKKVGRCSANQLALERFFVFEENARNLRELFRMMLGNQEKIELGYFVFSDKDKIIGGGALVQDYNNDKKANLAIHIIDQGKGLGDLCLNKILRMAFIYGSIDEIWVRSAEDSFSTASFMGKHGMIIKSENEQRFYYIDREIYRPLKI